MMMFAATGKAAPLFGSAVKGTGRLGLLAAPTFALMAWISAAGSPVMTICSVAPAFVPINDMTLMYLLMSFFHASPWLKFLGRLQHHNTQTEGD